MGGERAVIMVTISGDLGQNKYDALTFFPRKVTVMFTFQESKVCAFTSLVLKGFNKITSLGNWSQIIEYYYFALCYCDTLSVVSFQKISIFTQSASHWNYLSPKR